MRLGPANGAPRIIKTMAKTLATVFGVVFVIVWLLGFVGNPLVGEGALFHTNLMHDLVHLIIGIVLLVVAFMAAEQSALTLKIFGAVYLIVAVLGFFMTSPILGLIEVNGADQWLHLVLGVVLVAAGVYAKDGGGMGTPMSGGMPPLGGNRAM